MPNIEITDANAWSEPSKHTFTELDADLEAQVSSQVLARLSGIYNVSAWASPLATPTLVKKVIAMLYVAWTYDKAYSTGANLSEYAQLLRREATNLLDGIVTGIIDLDVEPEEIAFKVGQPSFEKSDPVFTMGSIF